MQIVLKFIAAVHGSAARAMPAMAGVGMLQLGVGGAASHGRQCYPSQFGLLQPWAAVLLVHEDGDLMGLAMIQRRLAGK